MKSIMKKRMTSTILLLIALSSTAYAESAPNLPTSSQITKESNKSVEDLKETILPDITVQTEEQTQKSNPNLKQGEACDDQTLNATMQTPTEYKEIPIAKTIPCAKDDCKNLKPALLKKDNHEKIAVENRRKLKPCIKK